MLHGAEALEAAIADDIDDEAALQVWSDFLTESADALGSVIAMWVALEQERDPERRTALRRQAEISQARILGDQLAAIRDGEVAPLVAHFRFGLVRRAFMTIEPKSDAAIAARAGVEVLSALLGSSIGRFVRTLRLPTPLFPTCASVLAAHRSRALVDLTIFGRDLEGVMSVGPLEALPNLRSLWLESTKADFTGARLATCETLAVCSDVRSLETLGTASMPSLRRLEISGRTWGESFRPKRAEAIAEGFARFPELRVIFLGSGLTDLAAACERALPHLESVEVSSDS